ncbi:DUF294 nucleotidyltransferase-like domain-containing protein [Intrasporangium mesophilum]
MQEYIDFLGKQAPYDRLDEDDLARLGRLVEVEYFASGTTIVEADQPQLDHLFVVRTGMVQVMDRGRVVDELGPGDTFGHISVLSGLPPPLSVVASSDTLCYLLPDPRRVLAHPERLTFSHYHSLVSRPLLVAASAEYALREVSDFMRPPTWVEEGTAIRDAAMKMSQDHQSCVLFRTARGLGIMTDSDCRRLVATGLLAIDAPVRDAGNVPALTVDAGATAATALLEMVHHGVHHLVVCAPGGEAIGIVRAVDLGSADVRDPLITRSAIENARDLDELRQAAELLLPTVAELHANGLPSLRIGALLGAMTEAVIEKCVSFSPYFGSGGNGEGTDQVVTSWLVLGSLARREPLPWSDIDTGLIWSAPPGLRSPDPRRLQDAAESVIRLFERCGLRRCPDGANASNPLFNRSSDAWLAAASHWVERPEAPGALLLPAIIADSRPITGMELGRSVTRRLEGRAFTRAFLQALLNEALANRPPTGFVRDFVVEATGRHRGELNLKRGGLQPVVAMGRWIAITLRSTMSSTVERLRAGTSAGLLTTDEGQTLEGGFEDMYDLLFTAELEALLTGVPVSTYMNPHELDTLARRHLRESFRAIAKVQTRLEAEWISRLG